MVDSTPTLTKVFLVSPIEMLLHGQTRLVVPLTSNHGNGAEFAGFQDMDLLFVTATVGWTYESLIQ